MVEPTQEYGFRDLGIIQELRRQYLEPDFSRTTNDLALALRFYELRRRNATNAAVAIVFDRIFTNLMDGQIETANQELHGLSNLNSGLIRAE